MNSIIPKNKINISKTYEIHSLREQIQIERIDQQKIARENRYEKLLIMV